ncbi:pancreatic prohormone [Cricetulus griseus]|uniref:pancreatic prohormone n=1 Tax=Cricetulus griseus TaxID=10029 RepID=UPI0007DA8941|nr:pancreatic prohormone [Cricetulus griseus]
MRKAEGGGDYRGAEDYKGRSHVRKTGQQEMATTCRCLSLFLLSTWVTLLLQPLQGAWGAPLEPMYPGDYATPEQMAQYATQLRRYINTQTRPRYGKREGANTAGLPRMQLAPCTSPLVGLIPCPAPCS